MAQGDISIGIPGAGTSDFAALPIPSLAFNRWSPDAGAPVRGEIGYASLAQRSTNGLPQIVGPAYGEKFLWPVAAMLTLSQARQLGALAKWQSREYKASRDGALRLIDEVDYVDSEPTPHSRTLLSSIPESWNSGYVYGYPVCPVLLQLPQDWKQFLGKWNSSGVEARLATFTLIEL